MFWKLLLHSFRNLKRQKSYVFINILGLAIGIAGSLIIALYVLNELSYDKFHENKSSIYRVILNGKLGEQEVHVSSTASPLGPAMRDEFPEVEDFVRVNSWSPTIIKYENETYSEEAMVEVDSSFFNIFSFELLSGDPDRVLNEPNVLVISESVAKKLFGDKDPLGKTVQVANISEPYRITGVMADLPENSNFEANILASFMTNRRANDGQWLSNSFETYIKLREGALPEKVDERFPGMISKYVGPDIERYFGISIDEFFSKGNKYRMYLQPLTSIHFEPGIDHSMKSATDPKYLYIFGVISFMIILIAAINFMNLSTAQASKRAREVGMKKVCGSSRTTLVLQFLMESSVLSFIALGFAVVIIWLSLPYFNNLLGVRLQPDPTNQWYIIPALIFFSLVVGVIAGSYPAFYLSSFVPQRVLKGSGPGSRSNNTFRSVLVILQFTISIVLIIGTSIMFRQIRYMQKKDLGFDRENILVVSSAQTIGRKVYSFKEEVRKLPEVINIASSTAVPGHNNNTNGYALEGRSEESFLLETNWVDFDYLETYGLEVMSGRFFNQDYPTDSAACLINQTTISQFSLDDPLATRFLNGDDGGEMIPMPVIGVVRDFHFRSLVNEIQPYVLRFKTQDANWGYISIKLGGEYNSQTISKIEEIWKTFSSDQPLQYFFMDESLEKMYAGEKKNASLAILFSILAIFIGSLGLFGLTSYTVEQRTKEIGIRKAMGASVVVIFRMIAKDILLLVCISAIIASPLTFYVAREWLQNYYYRIDPGIFDFLPGIFIAILVALLTISFKTIRTARLNPAGSLRYE